MIRSLLHPTFLSEANDDTGGGAPAEAPAAAAAPAPDGGATAPAATPAPEAAPAPAPWAADLETRFTDPAIRAEVDAYLREKQQPYITKLEQERADAQGKAWVYDGLNEDPLGTLQEIAAQVWDDDTAARIAELIEKGKEPEAAVEQAAAEAEGKPAEVTDPPELDLSKLPPEVREAVEFAQAEKARREAADQEATSQQELDAAVTEYNTWRAGIIEANPDIVEMDLHGYVIAAEGDLEQALANYRSVHPAPEAPPAPPTLGTGGSNGGIQPTRAASSLGEAFGDVFDAAHAGRTTL